MRNLQAEMARYGVKNKDLSSLLSCTDKTIKNKLDGETEFTVGEALSVRDSFFPGLRISYLFADTHSDE